MKKKIILLGCTGSIGQSVLGVIRAYPEYFELIGVSAYNNIELLDTIIKEFQPKLVGIKNSNRDFESQYNDTKFFYGESGLSEIVQSELADTVIIAVSGIAGLKPTVVAIQNHKHILSANKESIVAAGDNINNLLMKHNAMIVPLDSEHNAVFNLIRRFDPVFVSSIGITASGGPFLNKDVTPNTTIEDVLKHPTWNMGRFITVNSATMINKGFEVIEAHHLFNFEYERIKVYIHPQSIVHGFIESIDGTIYIAASPNDMKYPIALSMFYPSIPPNRFKKLELSNTHFDYFQPDYSRFPLLKLCYEIGKEGGTLPAVLNAVNERAVEFFLKGQIPFIKLPAFIMNLMDSFQNEKNPDIDRILEIDKIAKQMTDKAILSLN